MTKTPQLATDRFLRYRHRLIQRPRRLDRLDQEFAVYQDLGGTMSKIVCPWREIQPNAI